MKAGYSLSDARGLIGRVKKERPVFVIRDGNGKSYTPASVQEQLICY
jgi:purine nucleoside phosphorylase